MAKQGRCLGDAYDSIPGDDLVASRRAFTDELDVIDISPNMDSERHDRVQHAVRSYSLVLSNKQRWIAEQFPGWKR